MRTAAIAFCLTVGSLCPVKQADADRVSRNAAPAGSAAEADTVQPPTPSVTVLSTGKRPFHVFRWRFDEGAKSTIRMSANMRVTTVVDGRAAPTSISPPFISTMDFEVEEVAPKGDALLGFAVTSAALGDPGELDPETAVRLQAALESMVGMRGSYRCTTRGFISDVRVDIPPEFPTGARQLVESMRQSLRQIAAPLPERRLGKGAKWRADTEFEHMGVRIAQSSTFELIELRWPNVDVEVTVDQRAGAQPIATPGLPEEGWPRLSSLQSSGGGKAQWNMEQLPPLHAQMSVQVKMHMLTRDQLAGDQRVMMIVQTDLEVTGEQSEVPPAPEPFNARMVQAKIKARLWRIRGCYERDLPTNPKLFGKVTMEFRIEETGRVSRAEALENTTGSETLAGCIANALTSLRFDPAPQGGAVTFKYPFVFAPAQD